MPQTTLGPYQGRFASREIGFGTWTIFQGDVPVENGLTIEEARAFVEGSDKSTEDHDD